MSSTWNTHVGDPGVANYLLCLSINRSQLVDRMILAHSNLAFGLSVSTPLSELNRTGCIALQPYDSLT